MRATAAKTKAVRRPAPKASAAAAVESSRHGPSSPDQVVQAIKHGILTGRFVPGQRLVEADMTRDHKLSRGPVREALKRLAAEGIVEHSPHRGAHIRILSRVEVLEILQVLMALVGLAVRLAALRMKKNEPRARLKAAFERLSDHGPSGDRVLQSIDRNGFYDAIFSIAGNRELGRMHPVVPTQIMRMQVYPYLSPEDRNQQFADYKLLYDAIRSGNSREAQRIVVRHIRRSRLQIRNLPDAAFASE